MTTMTLAAPTDTGRCGEEAGHVRHRRRGEVPCQPCQDAANEAHRRRHPHRSQLRDARAELDRQPLPAVLGQLAGLDVWHDFLPLGMTLCAWCFGWRDDPRHPVVGGPVVGR
ncbi:hypothetical protein [Micromonospora deserti]|uniref:Uncharacterized protein n=1 Tax=Micromonospora deserti TaxID=2070366 RepID=A0A2W2CGH6_9ACTN|nr:hypothetical protein [Micromonospora deserti]PZF98531.1 hypothetical protein C1I99_13300 [Micromonospora deserti]